MKLEETNPGIKLSLDILYQAGELETYNRLKELTTEYERLGEVFLNSTTYKEGKEAETAMDKIFEQIKEVLIEFVRNSKLSKPA